MGIVRRAHFAFRSKGTGFTGGHSTYAVEADAGQLSVRPVQPSATAPPIIGTPLVIASPSFQRGCESVRLAEPRAIADDGRLVQRGRLVREAIENRDDGVELSWTFPARLPGDGKLEVRLATSGLEYAAQTSRGLHFRDPVSGLGIGFGNGTWIDAAGNRTEIPARWEGPEIVLEVPARVVDASAYPVLFDPTIGPETEIDSPVVGPASGSQVQPSTAYDAALGTYFVTWSDSRASVGSQVFATRIDSSGVVLDPAGILVSAPATPSSNPSAVFDGTNFLVVFESRCDIWGRRIAANGIPIDGSPFVVSDHPACQFKPFASAGPATLVTWEDARNAANSWDIYGARVLGSTLLDPAGIAIATAPDSQSAPKAAFGAGNWLVVWQDRRNGDFDIYGARVSGTTGAVLDPPTTGIAISTPAASNQSVPWPVSDGNNYFVVWEDARNTGVSQTDVYGARVTAAGGVMDASGIQVCNNAVYQMFPSVAFGGGRYQVVWQDHRGLGLYGNRVEPATGALLDGPAGTAILGPSPVNFFLYQPRIYATGGGFYVGWYVDQGDVLGSDVKGSRLTTTLSLTDAPGVELARSANGETQVAVAADGANYFVVWLDDRAATRAIYGARIDGATGASLDPAGILLSASGTLEEVPAVAFNGTNYLVVWYDLRQDFGIYATRVSTAGVVLDPGGVGLFTYFAGNHPYAPQVASDGTGWLVVWEDFRNGGSDVYGGRVDATGVALDPSGILISGANSTQVQPAIGYGGGYYLVVWGDRRNDPLGDIYGARVTPSGTVQDPSGIPIDVSPNAVSSGHGVAFALGHFVVPYVDTITLRRARIAAATGVVLDYVPLAASFGFRSAIVSDADTFLVIYGTPAPLGFGVLLKGTRLDLGEATDLDTTDWDVSTDLGIASTGIGIAGLGTGAGKALVAYSRYDPAPGFKSDRARTRQLSHPHEADLDVTKTDGQSTAVPGQPLTYTITVSNLGPTPATATSVTDMLPVEVLGGTWTCVASLGSGCTASGSGNINDTVDLLVGGRATYTLTGTVDPGATGTLVNTATVTSPPGLPDPVAANNSATDADTLAPQADLELIKSDSPDPVLPGNPLTYVLKIRNLGPSDATLVTVEDFLPSQVSFISVVPTPPFCGPTGSGVECNLGTLAPGATVTVTINTSVNAPGGVILLNEAVAAANETDPDPSNNSDAETTLVGRGDGELVHGTDAVHDLAALPGPVADEDVFRINQKPYSSYEVVIDATSGDIGAGAGPELARLAPNGNTVLQASVPVGTGPSRSLRWQNSTADAVETQTIRVRSASCTTDCGPDDVYRIRAYDTTYSIPRFNNSGTQITVLVVQNPTDHPIAGDAYFHATSGALAGFRHFILAPRETWVLDTTNVPGVSGVSGALTLAHDGRYGELMGKTVALEPATGFSFDSPLIPRVR